MLKTLQIVCLLIVSVAVTSVAAAPFRLPIGATINETSADGKGWHATGIILVPYVQAHARLMSAITAANWRFLHEITLGDSNDRCLLTFSRGSNELTVMVWRVTTTQSGFSYGVSNASARAGNEK